MYIAPSSSSKVSRLGSRSVIKLMLSPDDNKGKKSEKARMVRAMQPFIFDHGGAEGSFGSLCGTSTAERARFREATARCRDGQWLVLRETQCKRAGARQTRAMSCTAFSRDRRHLASMNELSSETTGHRREIATAGGSCAPSRGEGGARQKTFECFVQGDVKASTDLLGTSKQHV